MSDYYLTPCDKSVSYVFHGEIKLYDSNDNVGFVLH